ncbi:MAG TPA: nucleotidyltransferase family protein [Streptosporangiaceae bacterium]|nr:nucleotidyltransferase family protein [Streptosporangiaceae bacterium]
MTCLHRLDQTHPDDDRLPELLDLLLAEPWLTETLDAVAASGLPDAWIGAGVVRDVVWGQRYGGFDPAAVKDVDVAFFDPGDLSKDRDRAAGQRLDAILVRAWEATNQAAVHTWFAEYFGGPDVPAFTCVHDAVATWPETATCVAIRATPAGLDVCSPHGLADLLDGIWRRNPIRVSPEISATRLARQRAKWPDVTVIPDP